MFTNATQISKQQQKASSMTSKAAYFDKLKISFTITASIWTVRAKKTYSLNFLLRNLIVLILAGNVQLLYFIYKTLHSPGKMFCENQWKNFCYIWLGPHSRLCCCQSPPWGRYLSWQSQWGWLSLRTQCDFSSMRSFPPHPPDAWFWLDLPELGSQPHT